MRREVGSWKLGVKSNEDCFFADLPKVVLMVVVVVFTLTDRASTIHTQ